MTDHKENKHTPSREEKRAAALRANLKRRKAQLKERTATSGEAKTDDEHDR